MTATTAELVGRPDADVRGVGHITLRNFLFIAVQLALVLLLFRQFQIESAAFLRLATLAFAGFAIHAFLPLPYRLPSFVLLSLAGIVMVMGFATGAWLICIGLLLIGVCHLPVSFKSKSAVLLAGGAVLAAQRAQWLPAPWSQGALADSGLDVHVPAHSLLL